MKNSTRALINSYLLKQGVVAQVGSTNPQGSQIEIRKEGSLVWRAWEWEEGFACQLERYLKEFAVKSDTLAVVITQIKEQIGMNNVTALRSMDENEQQRLDFASRVLSEMVRRLQGELGDPSLMPTDMPV